MKQKTTEQKKTPIWILGGRATAKKGKAYYAKLGKLSGVSRRKKSRGSLLDK